MHTNYFHQHKDVDAADESPSLFGNRRLTNVKAFHEALLAFAEYRSNVTYEDCQLNWCTQCHAERKKALYANNDPTTTMLFVQRLTNATTNTCFCH